MRYAAKLNQALALAFVIMFPLAGLAALAAEPGSGSVRSKAAIFVENRAGAALNDKVAVFEDFLTSRITEKGFSVISREVAINALNSYPTAEIVKSDAKASRVEAQTPAGQVGKAAAAASAETSQIAVTAGQTKLDRLLSDNTSALRLAQSLGADYLFVASITSLGKERKTFQDGDFKTVNEIHTLRASYKVLEAVQGGSLIAGSTNVSKTVRFTENSQTESSDIVNELLDQAAIRLAEHLGQKRDSIEPPRSQPNLVQVFVSCSMQDLAQLPLLSDVRVLDDGTLVVTTNRLAVQVLNATVEVDGTSVGSAPANFKVRPGLSKMRITRAGFNDYERTVNFSEGQKFENVALQMSEAGYARWKDNTAFLFKLKTGEKLTDGVREMMGGLAQTLRQSGYRIDQRSDIKANVEAKGKSLFDGLIIQPTLFK